MAFDTVIRGGTVATASDTFTCDVGISCGKLAALGVDLGSAADLIDARACWCCPAASTVMCIWLSRRRPAL